MTNIVVEVPQQDILVLSPGVGGVADHAHAYALSLPGTVGNYASTPDSVAVSITSDIDIRVRVAADDWTPAIAVANLVSKWPGGALSVLSYYLGIRDNGFLTLTWVNAAEDFVVRNSTVATGLANEIGKWVRATLDADNGVAGHDVKFYTSADGDNWIQLGTTVTMPGITDINDSPSILEIGSRDTGSQGLAVAKIYYAEVRNGIDGPVVAKFDPLNDGALLGDTSFTASTGEVWTINQSGSPAAELIGLFDHDHPQYLLPIAVASVTPTAQNRTIEVEVGGTTYYLTAKTTND